MGILVGAFPYGVITVFDELYGSEILTQVYAMMIEYLSCLPTLIRQKLVEICYDDACHFKKYSENETRANFSDVTKFMAGLGKPLYFWYGFLCHLYFSATFLHHLRAALTVPTAVRSFLQAGIASWSTSQGHSLPEKF